MKRDCENCERFYECDNMGFYEECLPDMKFYEETMKYSVNIEKSISTLIYCLNRVYHEVDMEDWEINVGGGGTNYEIYFNFNIEDKKFEISSYPYYDDRLALGQIIKEINEYYNDDDENKN